MLSAVYFLTLYVFGTLILLNLFIAILVSEFETDEVVAEASPLKALPTDTQKLTSQLPRSSRERSIKFDMALKSLKGGADVGMDRTSAQVRAVGFP